MIASAPLLIYVFVAMSYTALGASVWSPVRTDDAAWQSACGHSKRVGAVCLDAHYGDRNNYKVQMNAVQNVIFSGNGKCESFPASSLDSYLTDQLLHI